MTTITRSTPIRRTARVMQLEGMFDMEPVEFATVEIANNIPALDEREWNIGLIAGPSGAGKSTVAHEVFGDLVDAEQSWTPDAAVIDEFPKSMGIRDVTQLLNSVGFSSPPAWLRPYDVLSNGERFRVSIARLLADYPDLAVVDEFTSVVDRTVAKIGSAAIAKAVRARGQKFVAVSCHYDVLDWLQPDWVYQPHIGEWQWRHLQRRPAIDLEVHRSDPSAWRVFGPHHYLDHSMHRSARVYVGRVEGEAAVLCAVLPFPQKYMRNTFRGTRLVVLPDFQGVGLGNALTVEVAANYKRMGRRWFASFSHPALIRSMLKDPNWRCKHAPTRAGAKDRSHFAHATGRLTASFEYVGPPSDSLVGITA